jgi:hypothetical protein
MSTAIHSEVFLREDIQSTLVAIDMANGQMAQWFHGDPREAALFRMGFRAAVESIATAFHVDLGQTYAPSRPTSKIIDSAQSSIASPTHREEHAQLMTGS